MWNLNMHYFTSDDFYEIVNIHLNWQYPPRICANDVMFSKKT